MFIEWSDDLSVGVTKIDDQHKELIYRADRLFTAMMDGSGRDQISGFLEFLADYTVNHFKDEEELMRQHNYPALREHKMLHDDFVKDFKKLQDLLAKGEVTSTVTVEVANKTGDWLRNHIRNRDKAVGQFLKKAM